MKEDICVTKSSMPQFEEYMEMIRPLWESRRLTNMGDYHSRLEEELRTYLDVPYLSLTVNGHMALELGIQAMGFPENAEVITTPFTFISTIHAIIRNRLVPVFCDIKLTDYTIDEEKIEQLITEKTVAILPVHVYGNICNVHKIQNIADRYNLKVLYDGAHAFGEKKDGISVGNFGDLTIFSFHATKVFHTIEGGAVASHEKGLYSKLYDLKNFGIRSEEIVAEVGANAKMNEFCAAMGICNLKYAASTVEERRCRVEYYTERLKDVRGLKLLDWEDPAIVYSYGYFPLLFLPEVCGAEMRDKVYDKLRQERIFARKYFYPIAADEVCFKNKYKKIPLQNARYAGDNILVLPLYPELEYEEIDRVVEIILELISGAKQIV